MAGTAGLRWLVQYTPCCPTSTIALVMRSSVTAKPPLLRDHTFVGPLQIFAIFVKRRHICSILPGSILAKALVAGGTTSGTRLSLNFTLPDQGIP